MALGKQRTTGRSDAGRRHRQDWRSRVSWPRRPAAWAARLAAGILLGLTARALAPHQSSEGSHHKDPLQCLESMTTVEWEQVCTWVDIPDPPEIDPGVAIARVNDTLYGQPQSWHGLGDDRIYFVGTDVDCRHDIKFHEIEYRVRETTDCDIPTASCANPIGPYADQEFESYDVEIYVWSLVDPDLYQFVINHETGHVFGLAHNPSGLSSCPGDSIMHLIDPCLNPPTDVSTYPWPSADDRASVEALMPPLTGGGSPDRAIPLF